MKNVKRLLRDWEEEATELSEIEFTVEELAMFIYYAYNSLAEDEFEILMEQLQDVI